MASIRQVMDDCARQISLWLAPYQPHVPPNFPNTASTAGTIPATLVAMGYPIQQHVMKRLENKMAQVAVLADKAGGKEFPFLNRNPSAVIYNSSPAGGVPSGVEYLETTRVIRRVCIQVWAYNDEYRDVLSKLLDQNTGEVIKLTHNPDQTMSLWKRDKEADEDFEQADSVYVRNIWWEVDFTETIAIEAVEATQTIVNLDQVEMGWTRPPDLTVDTL